jgi:hypothetical protein
MRHLFFCVFALLTSLALASVACSSSAPNNAIIGEWKYATDAATEYFFFDSNGSCGLASTNSVGGKPSCLEGTYTFDGSNLDITWTQNGGELAQASVTFSGNTMSLEFVDAGMTVLCTQVNNDTANTCP